MTEEVIGKIKLDYTYYPGKDFYCDGEIEDELLGIVQNHSREEFRAIIEEKASWPVLYHLSPLRENIVEWIPIEPGAKVLEIGSGCGAITGSLARRSGSVTCVDLSKKRSLINAYRNQECDNVVIHVGNFQDIEPALEQDYDYIFLIGVFEYGQGYIGGEQPYEEFMAIMLKHLKKTGRLAIAIENKYGLKYFAGCKEDHLGDYFSGIEDYPNGGGVRTFSRNGLINILEANQVEQFHFYYPYPDYKFVSSVYSDEYLPKVGELSLNFRNFDRDRLLLFDEKNAFDGLIKDGMFQEFSNSFMVLTGPEIETKYAKFSNDRADHYAIKTEIGRAPKNRWYVDKVPMTISAKSHVESIATAYELLKDRFEGSCIRMNQCIPAGEGLRFEFVGGRSLEELFDERIDRKDQEGFVALFKQYLEVISYRSDVPVSDFDLIFPNILIDGDCWNVIDYEWTFGKTIPPKELAYRAFYCYTLGAQKRREFDEKLILSVLGMTESEAARLREEEGEFQTYVTGERLPMGELRNLLGYKMHSPKVWEAKHQDDQEKQRVQVYEDRGEGFSEQESYFLSNPYDNSGRAELLLTFSEDVVAIRIDPVLDSCITTIERISWNQEPIEMKSKKITTNGVKYGEDTFVFETSDPNITIDLHGLEHDELNECRIALVVSRIQSKNAGAFKKTSKLKWN